METDAASRAGLLEGQLFCAVRAFCRERMRAKEGSLERSGLDLAALRTATDRVSQRNNL